jgi:hypothetical protein
MVAIITNNWLPKLYAFSALWTLNSRKGIGRIGEPMTSSEWHRHTAHLDLGSGTGRSIELLTGPGLHTIPRAGEYNNNDRLPPVILHGKREHSTRLPEVYV